MDEWLAEQRRRAEAGRFLVAIPFFVQCDTQVARQEELVSLLARAGCFEIFVGVESFSRSTLLAARKTQNYPSAYRDIVKLCRQYGIISHFSNILGFPNDTAGSIREHVDVLRAIDPDIASFYILCPIPGTEQYDEFLAEGSITEQNLDRFDGTAPTWKHPNLSSSELQDLLFGSYQRFYSARHVIPTAIKGLGRYGMRGFTPYIAHPVFSRVAARNKTHPMSGGLGRVRLDRFSDYADLRK